MKTWLWAKSKGLLCAILLAALVLPLCSPAASAAGAAADAKEDLTKYIDMHIGSSGESNTIIGPQRPNASVNPAPDTTGGALTGYSRGGKIQGFSQIHVSGTGVGKYGQFLVTPETGLNTQLSGGHDYSWSNEEASCSEYKVRLNEPGIDCALAPTEHATIYQFKYPQKNVSSLVVDMAHNLANGVKGENINMTVRVEGDKTIFEASGYYQGGYGWSFSEGGWGEGHDIYFYAEVNKAADQVGVYDDKGRTMNPAEAKLENAKVVDFGTGLGGFMAFSTKKDETVMMKVATSFKSVEQAKKYLDDEIPAWDYNAVKAETERQWNELLHKIVIDDSVSEVDKTIFYTAVYHAHVMPRDRTGEFERFDEDTPMIDDHFATWDTWRTLFPLYSITDPELYKKTVESFIARKEVDGAIRDSFVGGWNMFAQQGGDDTDNIIAEAILKGIVTGQTAEDAYAVLKDDAENFRLNWQGWDGVIANNKSAYNESYYSSLGYIPCDIPENGGGYDKPSRGNVAEGEAYTNENIKVNTCSYTLEYAYNDYCTAMAAKALGNEEDYQKYLKRSENWKNLWNDEIECDGYTGFIWPKTKDGTFIEANDSLKPAKHQASWSPYFYESSPYDYSFFVPQDPEELIRRMGGEETFRKRLLHGIEGGFDYIFIGNEPAFLIPYLFAYTSEPYRTTDVVNQLLPNFNTSGVAGNDDSGAMSSWYIFSTIGIFPKAGTDEYFFTSPHYPKTTIHLDNGKTLTLIANNLSSANKYIQSITINGEPYQKTVFTHDVITAGGEIVFEMGSVPVDYTKENHAEAAVTVDAAENSVDLDNGRYTEWAHFTSENTTNHSVGASTIAASGLTVTGSKETVSASPAFSWSAGKPTVSAEAVKTVVMTDGKVQFTVSLNSGESQLEVYAVGSGSAKLTVIDASGTTISEEAALTFSGTESKKATITVNGLQPETYTICLTAEAGSKVGVAAAAFPDLTTCTVRWDHMDGTIETDTVRIGSLLTEKKPVRSGYEFAGWYKIDDLTDPWDFASETVWSDMTLYAKWTRQQGISLDQIEPAEAMYINLDSCEDWMHFGSGNYGEHMTAGNIFIDRKAGGTAFGTITGEEVDRNDPNENKKYFFTWTNGATDDGKNGRAEDDTNLSWSRKALTLTVTIPAGDHKVTLYLSGKNAETAITVKEGDNVVIERTNVLPYINETRTYKIVTITSNYEEPKTYSIYLDSMVGQRQEWGSVGIAAATLEEGGIETYTVTATPEGNGSVSVRGGAAHLAGETVTVTARADDGYQFTGWVAADGIEVNNSLRNPLTFTMPAKDVTLKATFSEKFAAVESVTDISRIDTIDLSDGAYIDWAYMGNNDGHSPTTPDRKSDPKSAIIDNAIYPIDTSNNESYYRGEALNRTPYFQWSDGTIKPSRTRVSDVVWSANAGGGLYFDLYFAKGSYEVDLFLRAKSCGALLELEKSGVKVLDTKLWSSPGRDQDALQKVTISFDCDSLDMYRVYLRPDTNDRSVDSWYSVGIYAVAVRHLHEGVSEWTTDEENHWHECAFGETYDLAAHTFEWVVDKEATATTDGLRHQECTVCHYALEGEIIPATGPDTPPVTPIVPSKPSVSASKPALPFTDVSENASYYDAVKYVYEEGLMNGTSDTKFSPGATLNRAMVVTILHRMEGEPAVSYTGKFSDVADGTWYTDGVEWAAKNNIVTGYTNGKYGPLDPVTREQLAAILYRYAQYKGCDVTAATALDSYTDGANVSEYAKTSVAWAVTNEILESDGGKLRAKEEATRAEVAVAVASFHKTFVK